MKKGTALFSIFLSSGLFVCVIGLTINSSPLTKRNVIGEGPTYSLNLNTKKISSTTTPYIEEIESSFNTLYGSSITIKASNVIDGNPIWQTFMPNGYIYNPLTATTNKNKISGIKSIIFNSEDSKNLSLYYGCSINGNEIVYSHERTLLPNVTYSFDSDYPNYFYIKNNNNTSVDVSNISITYSCSDSGFQYQDLNVLMIGNSFADDTLFYATRVANSYGININLYDAYIAGCTINQHYTNLNNGSETYSMRSMNGNSWVYDDDMSLSQIINSHSWDIVTFQQASAEVGRSNSYTNLSSLVSQVRTMVGSHPKFYWYQTWAYDSDYHDYYDYFAYFNNDQVAMYNAINSCYQSEVAPLGVFDKIIPAGTAVQNLRTSYMKETFSRDGKHMSSVHGRYLLGLNFISTIYDIDLDLSPATYLPPEIDVSFKGPSYEAIRNAHTSPLNCTNSQYITRDLDGYDLSNYTEIDAGLVGCSYWNSTDSTNYNKRQSNVNGTSINFTSTNRFTSSTLPVGSIVVIDDSFGVRPEAWTSDSVQGSRPSERYDNVIEIDNSFWSGYQYRAFNIFKAGQTTLMGQFDQVFDGFHIYVPNNLVGGLKIKGVNDKEQVDRTLFTDNLLNFDSFERIHLDPITGFYKCDSYYELKNSYVDDTAKKFLCTRPFYSSKGDLPENTVIVVDSGYQWRSDCWGSYGSYSPRPGNVSQRLTRLDSSFWSGLRRRTFNVSSTSSAYVNQNYLEFMNHLRIYIPTSDDIEIEPPVVPDTVTMTCLGYASMNSTFASIYGKSSVPILITVSGDDVSRVSVQVDGSDAYATGYEYNKDTGAISITTTGSASGYTYGTITGKVYPDLGKITNIGVDGGISTFMTNNGSIECVEQWFDRCNYTTNAASQLIWQRWYMSGSWTANSGSGEWTTANNSYRLDNEYSMGLRIANNSYGKTRFTLKQDFNGGAGFTPKGISIWLYNPNGNIYPRFRIYVYTTPSATSGDHAVPSGSYSQVYETTFGIGNDEWRNIKLGLSDGTIYNVSFYFESNSSETTYVYLGHVSFY